MRKLRRNFEHPEGWTQPSFKLCAPEAVDIEGLMHVVVIQHLTPDLLRQPEFLDHANTCIGVNAMSGTIYDKRRIAGKLRRLLGEDAVNEDEDGVRVVLQTGQRLELLMPGEYENAYGAIAESPEPQHLGVTVLDIGRPERDTHQALAIGIEMFVQVHRETARIDDAANFNVVVREHDAEIAGTPFHVTATWRHREPEALEGFARGVEVPRRDDGMVDELDAVVRMHVTSRMRGSRPMVA